MKLAIDIGGTVISLVSGKLLPKNHYPYANYLDIPAVHGAWDCVPWLARRLGDDFVLTTSVPPWAIDAQARIKAWLKHHRITSDHDFQEKDVHFLLANERDETDLCKRLAVTHFVSNKAKSLPISGVKYLYLLDPSPEEHLAALRRCGDCVKVIPSWLDIFEVLGI